MKNVIAKCGTATTVAIMTLACALFLMLFLYVSYKNRWGQYFDGADPMLALATVASVIAIPVLLMIGLGASIASLLRNERMSILSILLIAIDLLAIVAIFCTIGLRINFARLTMYLVLCSIFHFGCLLLTLRSPWSLSRQPTKQRIQFAEVLPTLFACLGTVLLLITLTHIRTDQSNPLQQTVTFVNFLGISVLKLAYLGLGLSFAGLLGAATVVKLNKGRIPRTAIVATIVAIFNALATLLVHYVLWEY